MATSCSAHRPRYRRLWRLPTARSTGTVTLAATVVAVLAGLLAPPWAPLLVVALAAGALAGLLRRHRPRLAIEIRMARTLVASRPTCGDIQVPGLDAEVRAGVRKDGVTRIEAASWRDAVRALGFVMGRDRGFHLDLMRRTAAGRLAEVWGRTAVPVDEHYRRLGFGKAAKTAARHLQAPERDLLEAFADGVNAALAHHPFESRFLSYGPRPWTVEDSVLIALSTFHGLSWNEEDKRAEAVMRAALPADVAAFFLPGGGDLPEGLARYRGAAEDLVTVDKAVAGSNCWAAAGLLACDPHLPLTLPNLLYEVDLAWPGGTVRGLAVPGLPAVLTGTNGHLAWGITNLTADVLDLVPAERTEERVGRIRVRGGSPVETRTTWSDSLPVSPRPLLGQRVAMRWTGYDPRACDLKLQRLAHARSVEEGIKVLEEAEGIALNVLLTDTDGHLAHLATGLLPKRPGEGHLTGAQRPRSVDPTDNILVSANDSAFPEKPYRIGYDSDPGVRARRIRHLLTAGADSAEAMRALQHDTAAELYEPYRDIAVRVLTGRDDRTAALLAAWDGTAGADSRAFPVLVRLRAVLARRVLSPFLAACRELEPDFRYAFRCVDRPLLAVLRSNDASLLPPGLVEECVTEAVEATARDGRRTWGETNQVGLDHPLVALVPWAAPLLSVPATPQPGALHTVRTCVPGFAAAGRAVLSPHGDACFDLPAGQSGHPLSVHFDDRHARWSNPGTAVRPPDAVCTFVLRPAVPEATEIPAVPQELGERN
ncbi:penicillin acylase family protein [Streptomyces diastaticus]|uniref:Peptidase n=1 Tax=Streptomyces diastaticus subsp. diastaticus TaxID=68040 RepID=A0ABQ1CSA4_STRDI|nr:penicillin acylase family protein [Streptomyces diastaticus]GFH73237.1 peptidase [Streptomyces diastaticus subsp. diastaticus]GGU46104.1 peptidase [Streptomyces diastaticus subsp. diastaticus]